MIDTVVKDLEKFEQVEAIAIGGSTSAQTNDNTSDIDIYVFVISEIPVEKRFKMIEKYSSKYEVGAEYFGSGDEFIVDKINKQFDVMYWDVKWFETTIYNVWEKHYPSNGYSTAFLYTLHNFKIIYDKNDWLANLQNCIKSEYPLQLQKNIVKRNMMLLKDKPFASYYEQIEKALKRNDIVSFNHRIAAFISSYFDIIFAINKIFHPGEKRLIQFSKTNCKILPANFEKNLDDLLSESNKNKLQILDDMIINLKNISADIYH